MGKKFLYIALSAPILATCLEQEIVEQPSISPEETEAQLPVDVTSGELLMKFRPEMTAILNRTMTRATRGSGVIIRSGTPSADKVLDILGGYHFGRIFPVDSRNEERTCTAGLYLWYSVRFDEDTDLQQITSRPSCLGKVSKIQGNSRIKCAYNTGDYRTYVSEAVLQQKVVTRTATNSTFSDPGLQLQWHHNNMGINPFDNPENGAESIAGCDVGCVKVWAKRKGDLSIIAAVLDEGVIYIRPDLKDSIWMDEQGNLYSDGDNDGNGCKGDRYGYNFVTNSVAVSWTDTYDTGHGTHVAGNITAVSGNDKGVCGIADEDGATNSGVEIMSYRIFVGQGGATLSAETQAIRYAVDNGAVIPQCSWGCNSADANIIDGFIPGPATEAEWTKLYPLEKGALDYFTNSAGPPNGVIDGGITIFASDDEYARIPAFPSAYSRYVSVSSIAAGFTPASYTNSDARTGICTPDDDVQYYSQARRGEPEYWLEEDPETSGSILSTMIQNRKPAHGYMDGISMACLHVSGVAALGLSYAVKQRRHFKADGFVKLLKESVKLANSFYAGIRKFHRDSASHSASLIQTNLSTYIDKMGTEVVSTDVLLNNIEGNGSDMEVPNVYMAEDVESTINLADFFIDGEKPTYTCTPSDEAVARVTVSDALMRVTGAKTGSARITMEVSDGTEQTIIVTVRKEANDDSWM